MILLKVKYTLEKRLEILDEWKKANNGSRNALARKYDVATQTIRGWEKIQELHGNDALLPRNGKRNKYTGDFRIKVAEELINRLYYQQDVTERVSYLVAHHHTYSNIDGIDYQILVEADFLVNLYENQNNKETIQNTYNKIFKTASGRKLCSQMFMEKN